MLARDARWTNPPLKGVLMKEMECLQVDFQHKSQQQNTA
jgi:hypothetical protein